MDDFLYNDIDMTGSQLGKIALIDSGNTSIQIPLTMFNKLMTEMQKRESTISSKEINGNQILIAKKPCNELYDSLDNIEFKIEKTKIIITPRGYLYYLDN